MTLRRKPRVFEVSMPAPCILRFGRFEFDPSREELRRSGTLVHLPPQTARLLGLLLRRAGEVVGREEIRQHLWPDGTVVEYEQGINHAVRRIRSALGDDATACRFVETLPRVGYRFLAAVEVVPVAGASDTDEPSVPPVPRTREWGRLTLLPLSALAIAVGLAGAHMLSPLDRDLTPPPEIHFESLTQGGRVWAAALSPDGAQFAYAQQEEGGFALHSTSLAADRSSLLVRSRTRFGPSASLPTAERSTI